MVHTFNYQRTPTIPIGFANFYQRFIQNFSSIIIPLTDLLKNRPKSLSWTPAATQAFQSLKKAFTSAPLLIHPDLNMPFIVEVNTSTTRVGAVLSQRQGIPAKLRLLIQKKYPWWRETMTLATENCSPSSSSWRNGGIGWRVLENRSLFSQITRI